MKVLSQIKPRSKSKEREKVMGFVGMDLSKRLWVNKGFSGLERLWVGMDFDEILGFLGSIISVALCDLFDKFWVL